MESLINSTYHYGKLHVNVPCGPKLDYQRCDQRQTLCFSRSDASGSYRRNSCCSTSVCRSVVFRVNSSVYTSVCIRPVYRTDSTSRATETCFTNYTSNLSAQSNILDLDPSGAPGPSHLLQDHARGVRSTIAEPSTLSPTIHPLTHAQSNSPSDMNQVYRDNGSPTGDETPS